MRSLEKRFLMWESRDLTLVIIISVVSFVYSALVSQLPNLITGVPGFNYLFIFGHGIFISFGLLMYEGRRWRFLLQNILVMFLTLPTFQTGAPFDVLARMPIIESSFISDLIFTGIYPLFQKRSRLLWWSIIVTVVFILQSAILISLNMFLFYSSEVLSSFVSVYMMLLPLIIAEAAFGALIGYRAWRKLQKTTIIN